MNRGASRRSLGFQRGKTWSGYSIRAALPWIVAIAGAPATKSLSRLALRAAIVVSLLDFYTGSARAADWRLASSETLAAGSALPVSRQSVNGPNGEQAAVYFVCFDLKRFSLKVIDQGADGRESLGEAMARSTCLAGVNGGYFHPDFSPVGLLVSNKKTIHGSERASLLSGVLEVSRERSVLRRPGEKAAVATEALQAGPFLVDGDRAVAGLNAARSARRTVVVSDGAEHWALVSTSALTLAQAGDLLAAPGIAPAGLKVRRALNLDGGASTGLWVRAEPSPFYLSEFSTVRDFLGVVAK